MKNFEFQEHGVEQRVQSEDTEFQTLDIDQAVVKLKKELEHAVKFGWNPYSIHLTIIRKKKK